jgi:hypothetical protein
MTRSWLRKSLVGIRGLALAYVACTPLEDLSSYSRNVAPEATEPLPPSVEPQPVASTPPSAEQTPQDASADAASPDSAPPPPAASDAAVERVNDCAATGGLEIAETSSCYLIGATTLSWQEARSICQAWGGDLVEIGSAEAGGGVVGYVAWAPGQPNDRDGLEDCTELRTSDNQWNDLPCTGNLAKQSLCERVPASPAE